MRASQTKRCCRPADSAGEEFPECPCSQRRGGKPAPDWLVLRLVGPEANGVDGLWTHCECRRVSGACFVWSLLCNVTVKFALRVDADAREVSRCRLGLVVVQSVAATCLSKEGCLMSTHMLLCEVHPLLPTNRCSKQPWGCRPCFLLHGPAASPLDKGCFIGWLVHTVQRIVDFGVWHVLPLKSMSVRTCIKKSNQQTPLMIPLQCKPSCCTCVQHPKHCSLLGVVWSNPFRWRSRA